MLISGSGVPLYDPLTFYQQLMHEDKSRVKVCKAEKQDKAERWRDAMAVSLVWAGAEAAAVST